jgi:hypothetical protein
LENLAMKKFFTHWVPFLISLAMFLYTAWGWITAPMGTPGLVLLAYAGGTFLTGALTGLLLFRFRGERSRMGLAADVFYRAL